MTAKKTVKSKDPTQKAIGALQAAINPRGIMTPPDYLKTPEQLKVWDDLTSSKPHEAWAPTDALLLGLWVKTYTDILRLDQDIKIETEVVENQRGTPVANPKCTVRAGLTGQLIALSTKLRLTPSSRDNDNENNAGRNETQKTAKKAAQNLANDEDDLLSGFSRH